MSFSGQIDTDNIIEIHETADISTCKFNIIGKRNRVFIGSNCVMRNCRIEILSDNNDIFISENCRITANIIIKISENNKLFIDKDTSCGGANIICGESTKIKIGKDCMLAWGIEIRSTDSHAIFDKASGERINKAENIEIKDHVWIGAQVTILSGSYIAEDSVVGIRSVIKNKFTEEGSIIVGSPAKVVKQGVTWDRYLLG